MIASWAFDPGVGARVPFGLGSEIDGPEFETATWYNGRSEASIVATFDYDGDGIPEAISNQESHGEDDGPPDHYKVHAIRNGSVVEYPPAHGLSVAGVEDVDKDGRPTFSS